MDFSRKNNVRQQASKSVQRKDEIKERIEIVEHKILSWYQQTRDEKFAEFFDIVNTRKIKKKQMEQSRVLRDSVVVHFEEIKRLTVNTEHTPKAAIEEENIRLRLEIFALTEMLRRAEIRVIDKKLTLYREAEFVYGRDISYVKISDDYAIVLVNGKEVFYGNHNIALKMYLSGKIDIHTLTNNK